MLGSPLDTYYSTLIPGYTFRTSYARYIMHVSWERDSALYTLNNTHTWYFDPDTCYGILIPGGALLTV